MSECKHTTISWRKDDPTFRCDACKVVVIWGSKDKSWVPIKVIKKEEDATTSDM